MLEGFPNQVKDLVKLGRALGIARELHESGKSIRDDGEFGEALVRAGVIRPGRSPLPPEDYLAQQRQKPLSNQSFRTTARGLRELFILMKCLDADDATPPSVWPSPLGLVLARDHTEQLTAEEKSKWRIAIAALELMAKSTQTAFHPYQVLLRLAERFPAGMPREYCALCLEAKNDSDAEIDRLYQLTELGQEMRIWEAIGGNSSRPANWQNAKKIIPGFAEQLGDLIKADGRVYLPAGSPSYDAIVPDDIKARPKSEDTPKPQSLPARKPRAVSAAEIAKAGTSNSPLTGPPTTPTEEELAATIALRAERLTRHNMLVRRLATILEKLGASLTENPFDCLATLRDERLLIEAKTLCPSGLDERDRVRDALGQLLYYARFAVSTDHAEASPVALFERKPSDEHIAWLATHQIRCIWPSDSHFIVSDSRNSILLAELAKID